MCHDIYNHDEIEDMSQLIYKKRLNEICSNAVILSVFLVYGDIMTYTLQFYATRFAKLCKFSCGYNPFNMIKNQNNQFVIA